MFTGALSTASFREMSLSYLACWQLGRVMKFASLEVNLVGVWGLLVYLILLFSFRHSGRSPDMTEILLTRTLNLSSNKNKQHTQQVCQR